MRYPTVVISNDEVDGNHVVFSKENSHYLRSVLRLRRGDVIRAICGNITYLVEIDGYAAGCVLGRVTQQKSPLQTTQRIIDLAFSCVRPAPTEEIFRHGTELGVTAFYPIIAERSNRRPVSAKDRWQRVVASAVSQSRRNSIPTINQPVPLSDFLTTIHYDSTRLILSTEEEPPLLLSALESMPTDRVTILVGPEGGFTSSEMNSARDAGFRPVSLCRNVLRTETAALLSVGLVNAWHDWEEQGRTKRAPHGSSNHTQD